MGIGDLPAPFDASTADLSDAARTRYADALAAEWQRLLDDPAFTVELNIQAFMERHPSLVPGAFGLSMHYSHPPWPSAVITQPPLPDLSTKRPDFMWISTDSATLRPVLVEIERPDKRWFHASGGEQHSELTTPLTQVAHWRAWFQMDGNPTRFLRHYQIPRPLLDRPIRPHFVIVHGRRHEGDASPELSRLRSSIVDAHRHDTTIMTFDRVTPDRNALDFGTVRLDPDGVFRMQSVPGTFALLEGDGARRIVHTVGGLVEAITASPDIAPHRKDELLGVVRELQAQRPPGLFTSVARRR